MVLGHEECVNVDIELPPTWRFCRSNFGISFISAISYFLVRVCGERVVRMALLMCEVWEKRLSYSVSEIAASDAQLGLH